MHIFNKSFLEVIFPKLVFFFKRHSFVLIQGLDHFQRLGQRELEATGLDLVQEKLHELGSVQQSHPINASKNLP
jgi:hypothetical protein